MAIKLMSWNVAKRTRKLHQQLERIDDAEVDILALQEFAPANVEELKEWGRGTGLAYVGSSFDLADDLGLTIGPSENGRPNDGLLIASRWPLELKPGFFKTIPWQKSALSVVVKSDDYGSIEIHTVHVPNASSSGRWEEGPAEKWNYGPATSETKRRGRRVKVSTFNAIFEALATESNGHRILCGDFNSPKEEHSDGAAVFFGQTDEHKGSEKSVIHDLSDYDLKDTYRELHDYQTHEVSWRNRRFDHIFSSSSLNPIECEYLHEFRESGLSDHSPVYAVYEPERQRRPRKKKSRSRSD